MNKIKPAIGVLALQGAVEPHKPHIEAAGGEFRTVKTPQQFEEVYGFILPGGESTTMLRLIETFDLWQPLEKQFQIKPVWGICAGAILLAERVYKTAPPHPALPPAGGGQRGLDSHESLPAVGGGEIQKSFALLPIEVQRNAYGRQLDSHHDDIDGYKVSFIRAPVITDPGSCTVLGRHNGDPVWLEQGRHMVTTFHPELTLDYPSPMHRAFIDLVSQSA